MTFAGALNRNETANAFSWEYNRKLARSMTDDEALMMVQSKRGDADRGRDPLHLSMHKTWFVSILHFLNLRNYARMTIEDLDASMMPHDSAYSANLIMPYVMRQISRLASINPAKSVLSQSTDMDDTFAAETGESLLAYLDARDEWDQMRAKLAWWMVLCGHGFLYTDWDPNIGKALSSLKNPYDGAPIEKAGVNKDDLAALSKMGGVNERRTGDLDERVVSPFEVTVPRGTQYLSNAPWVIIEREVEPGYIWDRWPEKAVEITPDDYGATTENFWFKRLRHMSNQHGYTLPTAGAEADETVTLITMWIPPSGFAPDGFRVQMTRSMVLEKGPHPFYKAGLDYRDPDWRYMRYPITDSRYIPVEGRYWGMGLVENLIGPQMQANIATDQLIRQRDRLGSPVWLSPAGAQLKHTGDVWTYKDTASPPILVDSPAIGQPQVASDQMVQGHMQFIASQSPMTLGQPSSGVRSGSMLQQAEENDNEPLGATFLELKTAYVEHSKRALTLFWKFLDTEKAIQVRGESRLMDVVLFKGSDLNGNVFVDIDNNDMKPKSRSAQIELVMAMMQGGLIDPTNGEDKKAALDAVQFRNLDHLFHAPRLHLRRARQEQLMYLRPQVEQGGRQAPWPDTSDYDDHLIHIEEHKAFMASDQYERMPILAKMAFQGHMRKHEQIIAEAMMAQMSMAGGGAQQQQGSPPAEKGQPSAPNQTTQSAPPMAG